MKLRMKLRCKLLIYKENYANYANARVSRVANFLEHRCAQHTSRIRVIRSKRSVSSFKDLWIFCRSFKRSFF